MMRKAGGECALQGLCNAIAAVACRLCTTMVDPKALRDSPAAD